MDEAGWASIDDVLRVSGLSRAELDQIVRADKKQRFETNQQRIRAAQGDGADSGVSAEGLEASWKPYLGDASIWHGTNFEALESIANEGILPQQRTHVHPDER